MKTTYIIETIISIIMIILVVAALFLFISMFLFMPFYNGGPSLFDLIHEGINLILN